MSTKVRHEKKRNVHKIHCNNAGKHHLDCLAICSIDDAAYSVSREKTKKKNTLHRRSEENKKKIAQTNNKHHFGGNYSQQAHNKKPQTMCVYLGPSPMQTITNWLCFIHLLHFTQLYPSWRLWFVTNRSFLCSFFFVIIIFSLGSEEVCFFCIHYLLVLSRK